MKMNDKKPALNLFMPVQTRAYEGQAAPMNQ
jgi:hypothetical protein